MDTRRSRLRNHIHCRPDLRRAPRGGVAPCRRHDRIHRRVFRRVRLRSGNGRHPRRPPRLSEHAPRRRRDGPVCRGRGADRGGPGLADGEAPAPAIDAQLAARVFATRVRRADAVLGRAQQADPQRPVLLSAAAVPCRPRQHAVEHRARVDGVRHRLHSNYAAGRERLRPERTAAHVHHSRRPDERARVPAADARRLDHRRGRRGRRARHRAGSDHRTATRCGAENCRKRQELWPGSRRGRGRIPHHRARRHRRRRTGGGGGGYLRRLRPGDAHHRGAGVFVHGHLHAVRRPPRERRGEGAGVATGAGQVSA